MHYLFLLVVLHFMYQCLDSYLNPELTYWASLESQLALEILPASHVSSEQLNPGL